MNKDRLIRFVCISILVIFILSLFSVFGISYNNEYLQDTQNTISGFVFEDINNNQVYDKNDKGISGVSVSNGQDVVETDKNGFYILPVKPVNTRDDQVIFISKPDGYDLPLNEYNIPQFYHICRSSVANEYDYGSYDKINFPLCPTDTNESFKVLVLGDIQPRDDTEVGYIRDSVSEILSSEDYKGYTFAISLGDNVYDNLSLYPHLLDTMSLLGLPIYYVPGNHDMDYDVYNDEDSLDTYKSYCGPSYYSFNYCKVHFVVLDSVYYDGKKLYHGELGDKQLEWLKNDLSFVSDDNLIVLNMHLPIVSFKDDDSPREMIKDRDKLFELLDGRPVLALAGHTHTLERFVPGEEYGSWGEPLPFPEIIAGAVCGRWWSGPKDESGIPLSYQSDGTPRGYMVFEFDGNGYKEKYNTFSKNRDMNVSFTSEDVFEDFYGRYKVLSNGIILKKDLGNVYVLANVFNGDKNSTVEVQIDDRGPIQMKRDLNIVDPYGYATFDYDIKSCNIAFLTSALAVPPIPQASQSTHIWTTPVPDDLEPGLHKAMVTAYLNDGDDEYISQSVKLFEVKNSGK